MSVLRHVAASHGAPLMAKHRRPGSRVGQSGLAAVVNPPVNGFPIRHSSERLVVIRTGHRVVGASAPDRVFGQVAPRTISTSSPAGPKTQRSQTEPVVDFGYGITNAVLTAAVFFGVLWSASGSADVFGWHIPGFMVYAAVVYSIVLSGSMVLFGRALIDRIEQRNQGKAQLRYELGRVRENAESIAMVGGADDEVKGLGATMQLVMAAWTKVVSSQAWLTWLMGGNGVMAPVLPLLLAAPNY